MRQGKQLRLHLRCAVLHAEHRLRAKDPSVRVFAGLSELAKVCGFLVARAHLPGANILRCPISRWTCERSSTAAANLFALSTEHLDQDRWHQTAATNTCDDRVAQLEREEISRAMSEGQSIRSFGARRR